MTTHKLDLFAACREMFDEIGAHAKLMAERSWLSKRDDKLICNAEDWRWLSPGRPFRRLRRRGLFNGSGRFDNRADLAPGGSRIKIRRRQCSRSGGTRAGLHPRKVARLIRALAVETHENWLEAHRCLNINDLREHKKTHLRKAA